VFADLEAPSPTKQVFDPLENIGGGNLGGPANLGDVVFEAPPAQNIPEPVI
jgi:hypothetical protein